MLIVNYYVIDLKYRDIHFRMFSSLSEGEEVVFEKASFEGPSHTALLGVYMEEALEAAKSKGIKLDAVAVSSGPGSYTGLRIGGVCG